MVAVPPIVVGLIFADRVLVDPSGKDISLIGVFEGKSFPAFPTAPIEMVVFLMVNGGRGEGTFELSVFALDQNGEHEAKDWVYRKRQWYVFPSDDPNRVLNVALRTKCLRFPKPGDYLFVLTLEGKLVAERRILIRVEQ